MELKEYMRTALAIVLGERCVVCDAFHPGAGICPRCLLRLPYTNVKGALRNPIERLFWGVLPIERATSMVHYNPRGMTGQILQAIKYNGRSELAVECGRMMAQELLSTDFFDGVDFLQPVPLHPLRFRQRGYNQSEHLARGISEVTGIPIGNFVKRTKNNVSQTTLSHAERVKNVENIFAPNTAELQRLRPQHLLVIDDVITTGSTVVSCVQSLTGEPSPDNTPTLRISIASLAFAGQTHLGVQSLNDLHRKSCVVNNTEFRERQVQPLS